MPNQPRQNIEELKKAIETSPNLRAAGKLLGISGERVRQLILKYNLPTPKDHIILKQRYCSKCNSPINQGNKTGLCHKCLFPREKTFVELTCSYCGRKFERWTKQLRRDNPTNPCCSNECKHLFKIGRSLEGVLTKMPEWEIKDEPLPETITHGGMGTWNFMREIIKQLHSGQHVVMTFADKKIAFSAMDAWRRNCRKLKVGFRIRILAKEEEKVTVGFAIEEPSSPVTVTVTGGSRELPIITIND